MMPSAGIVVDGGLCHHRVRITITASREAIAVTLQKICMAHCRPEKLADGASETPDVALPDPVRETTGQTRDFPYRGLNAG
jgi:hypothetical protein